jgi:hypothetical protein
MKLYVYALFQFTFHAWKFAYQKQENLATPDFYILNL